MRVFAVSLLTLSMLVGCFSDPKPKPESPSLQKPQKLNAGEKFVVLAGGCFWCMEPPYEKLDGVQSVISGFSGGDKVNPTYKEVAGKKTKHVEVVKIIYDPKKVDFNKLLDIYWRQIDPTDSGGQFVDRGSPYRPVIFYQTEEEKELAEKSKKALADSKRFKKPIVVPIEKYKNFYPAEDYHQDYYKKNPIRYKYYRHNSGRDQFLEKHWGKAD